MGATVELWRGKSRAATHGLERTLRVRRFDDATKRSQPYRKIVDGQKADTSDMPGGKLQGIIAYEHTSPGTVAISAPAGSDLSHHVVDFTFGMPLSRSQRARYLSPSADKVFHHFVHVVPTKYQLPNRRGFTAFQFSTRTTCRIRRPRARRWSRASASTSRR